MQLKQLAAALPALDVEGSLEARVTGLAYDSRRVTPGSVFFAIPGGNVDGHDYADAAVNRGAVAVVCAPGRFLSRRVPVIEVADPREAMALASVCFYDHPSSKLNVIGVTGTNGKTTVTFMIKSILEAAGIRTGLMGTVQYEVGDRVIPAQRTTPESLEVQQLMAQMLKADCQACVMEVSSHALTQRRVMGVEFDVAVFTNLTRDHLDYHGTMEDYFLAKERLFEITQTGGKRGAGVVNVDDPFGARLARDSQLEVLLTYGVKEAATLRATGIELRRDGSRFQVEAPDQRFSCRLPLIGRHNIYNALAAVGAGLAVGVDLVQAQAALNAMPCVPGRLERIDLGQPFTVLVDYAHTDDALLNVLTTVREVTDGRVLLAFGCGGSRDRGKRSRMGAVAARLADVAVVTTDNPRKESAEAIAEEVVRGFRQVREDGCVVELDRARAIHEVIRMAQEGDTVLIAGKGHETYQEFEDTVVPFDDRFHARETLETLGFTGEG